MKAVLKKSMKVYSLDPIMTRVDKKIVELMVEKPSGRFDPQYWGIKFQKLLDQLSSTHSTEYLDAFVNFITYGQVGKRIYNKKGKVKYIQTINLVPTGIDFSSKEALIDEGSHNDPDRSRLKFEDVLLGNAGMGGLGKCVIFLSRTERVNISQDIDILRFNNINPYYVTVFLKSIFGNTQIWIRSKGVGAPKLPFDEIKSIIIPILPDTVQSNIKSEYKKMFKYHDRAMEAKSKGNNTIYKKNIEKAETMLKKLIEKTEAVIRGEGEEGII